MTTQTKTKPARLLSLDILRGITIAGMILVNNPGSWGKIYAPLRHAEWHGLTPTDLVFPFFMFIMGVSTYMSLRRYNFRLSAESLWKVVRRTVVIFFIGIFIAWFGLTMRRISSGRGVIEAMVNFDSIRMLGVMPRLALCYGVGSLLALCFTRKVLVWIVGVGLAAYAAVLLLCNGLVFSADNIIAVIDRAVLGEAHMYSDTIDGITLKFDPEGLLSTIPSICHMLIGYLCGSMIMSLQDNRERVLRLFIVGACLTFAGLLLNYGCPINKKIWSPTFVLTTCGLASTLLALLMWVIDILGHKRWCRFFESFGVNPLFMYCLGAVLSILFGYIRVGDASLHSWLYNDIWTPLAGGDAVLGSLFYALAFVGLNWCVGYILYKKKIYIKI
ncbi:MAG: DUF5009 domain-containing protein [Muribaculaceae bacterium]|nr:DUF5009 domain-containing protein [Muribaculaceae bacterium]